MMEVKENDKIMISENIPSEWKIKKMDEFADIKIGGTPARKESKYWENGIHPWVSISDVSKSNKYLFNTKEKITDEGVQHSNVKLIPKNSVLMTFKLTLGKLVITSKSVYTNEAIAAILPNNLDHLITDYLYYALSNVDYERFIDNAVKGKTLNKSKLSNIKMLIPPLKEQQKIAEILSTVDEQIDQTDQLIEKTKELKKGLMQQLLAIGIGNTEFKQTDLGKIPVEWNVYKIDEVARVIRGASPRPKGDIRYYGGDIPRLMIADITRDGKYVTPSIDFLTEEGAKKSRPMSKGSFVVACSGTYVGYPSILNVDACIHDGIIALLDYQEYLITDFLYYIFIGLYNELNASATHGGVFNNLTTQIIREFKIKLPPLQEQQKIAEILSSVDADIEGYEEEKMKYEELKKGLMQQLLTGKTRVNVD